MKKITLIISALLILGNAHSKDLDRSKPPVPSPAKELEIGEYETFELQNGMKVFVVENHKLPKVSYSIRLKLDPILERENAGYVSLASEILGTATTTRTKDQIDEEVDFIGASLNVSAGGASGSSLKKHSDKLLEIMSDVVKNAIFNQQELDKVRKQNISGLEAMKQSPSEIAGYLKNPVLFGLDHPYGEIITKESLESVTLEMCQQFYDTYYSPSVAYMAIVGDITVDEAKSQIEKYFGDWIAKEVPKHEFEVPQFPKGKNIIVYDRQESVQSVIRLTYPVVLKTGSPEFIKARVMNTILGGGAYRLFDNLREQHGWTYGAYSSLRSDKLVGSFTASAEVGNSVTDSSVHEILYEMQRLIEEPVPEDELQRVKNYLAGSFALSLENPGTVAGFALNTAIHEMDKDYYKNYLKNLEAVTVEDVQEMAKKYLDPENCYVLIVGKAEEIASSLERFDDKIQYIDINANIE